MSSFPPGTVKEVNHMPYRYFNQYGAIPIREKNEPSAEILCLEDTLDAIWERQVVPLLDKCDPVEAIALVEYVLIGSMEYHLAVYKMKRAVAMKKAEKGGE